ncbi:hypothetical protein DXG01_006722 [Tephrocybe rancida]|nr:hypothetical protein DXG01_006722 [Tephrocybe rancida]
MVRRGRLSREERSMIRIMYNLGTTKSQIVKRLKSSYATVSNVLNGVTGRNDEGNDWDEVSAEFMREFLVRRLDIGDTGNEVPQLVDADALVSPEMEERVRRRPWPLPKPQVAPISRSTPQCTVSAGRIRIPSSTSFRVVQPAPTTTYKPSSQTTDEQSVPMIERPPRSSPTPETNHATSSQVTDEGPPLTTERPIKSSPAPEISIPPPIIIKVEDEPAPAPPLEDLKTFLKGLEHDMSGLAGDLEAQGLGTVAHLLAFSPWPEERLHDMFMAALPDITVPQRFMLVHGLKTHDI